MRIRLDTSKTLHGTKLMMSEHRYGRNTKTCPVCGTRFTVGCALADYCYQYKGRFFCRYDHMRQYIREHTRPSVTHVDWRKNGWAYDADWCKRRIAYCKQRIDEYEERIANVNTGDKTSGITNMIHCWHVRLAEAQEHLKAIS